MDDVSTPERRLAYVLKRVQLPAKTPVRLPSDSNDVWRIGSVILRVCWRGDRDRFVREAAVTAALPASVPYPQVLANGQDERLAWQVTRAIDGVPLARVWPGLTIEQRRDAMRQTGRILAALNAYPFPADVTVPLATPRPLDMTSVEALVGADIIPLPYERLQRLLGHARALPHVDVALIDDVEGCLSSLAAIDPLRPADVGPTIALGVGSCCIHNDAHLENVFWWDGQVVALLDFEWTRLGPPDLELEPYLRDTPDAGTDAEAMTRNILAWLAQAHPAAFQAPDLVARLWLYQLAFAVRQLVIWPPVRPAAELPTEHPLRRLRVLVEGPGHLHRLIPDAQQ